MADVIERTVNLHAYKEDRCDRKDRKKRIKKNPRAQIGTCLPTIRHDFLGPWFKPDHWSIATPQLIEEIVWRLMKDQQEQVESDAVESKAKSEWASNKLPRLSERQDKKRKESTSHVLRSVRVDKFGRLRPKHKLAQLLVDAARLFEEITGYQDRLVLKEYLFRDNSIHPRRSLDQSYMGELRTTRRRDRDQVVYRYTCPNFQHELFQDKDKKKPKPVDAATATKHGKYGVKEEACSICAQQYDDMQAWQWSWTSRDRHLSHIGHSYYEDKRQCQHCIEQSQMLARAVMVDQLWMWILDRNTILTCFPKRWGIAGKVDPSGVFQSVAKRLQGPLDSSNRVLSVYDLGLIILEECFDTFFDRTNMPDRRPQIMDIFAASIGQVVRCLPRLDPCVTR
jgi:hypothetical protein